jgi:hypothetical protein|nr:hypothetical protein Q903MT_gene5337 [Picea sitchensis]
MTRGQCLESRMCNDSGLKCYGEREVGKGLVNELNGMVS